MKKSLITKSLIALFTLGAMNTLIAGEKLVIKGSDTLGAKLVPQLAEAFKAKNPGVTFEIAAEGSSTGVAAIIDGTAMIGMSSRDAKATEISKAAAKGVDMQPIVVGFDGIAVIVNAGNGVDSLTREQVESIFTGDVSDWSEVGGEPGEISIYTRNTSSGTYKSFQKLAMSKRDYASSSQKMAGNEQIAAEVGKNKAGIGYVGLAYLKAPGIKPAAVNGALPTKESVASKKYPLARPLYYYVNGSLTGIAKEFVDFTLSAEGSKICETVGFVPAK